MPKLQTLKPLLKTADLSIGSKSKVANGYDASRGNSAARGYGHRWRVRRAAFLEKNPLCAHCHAKGFVSIATNVDHRIPHRGDQRLFWDESNWQGLCQSCHSIKTAAEDGGFGNMGAE